MHAALDLDTSLPEPLPPPPRRPRLARGSIVPYDLAIDVRPIEPPSAWSRVVPVSPATGMPLLARDRRPAGIDRAPFDRAAGLLVTLLASASLVLALLLAS